MIKNNTNKHIKFKKSLHPVMTCSVTERSLAGAQSQSIFHTVFCNCAILRGLLCFKKLCLVPYIHIKRFSVPKMACFINGNDLHKLDVWIFWFSGCSVPSSCCDCCATSATAHHGDAVTPRNKQQTAFAIEHWTHALSERSSSLGSWHWSVRGARMRHVRPGSQSDARRHERYAANSRSGVVRWPAGSLQSIRWEFNFQNRLIDGGNITIIYWIPKTLYLTSSWREAGGVNQTTLQQK